MYFFSYASDDEQVARAIARGLTEVGLDLWTDLLPGGMRTGISFQRQLEEAIEESSGYVALIGSRGVSGWVDYEKQLARLRQNREPDYPIVPVALPGVGREELPDNVAILPIVWLEGPLEEWGPEQFDDLRERIEGRGPARGTVGPSECQSPQKPVRRPRPRWFPWAAAAVGMVAIAAVVIWALSNGSYELAVDGSCQLEGTATAVEVRGDGLALLTASGPFEGARRVELHNAHLFRFHGDAKEEKPGHVIVEAPDALTPSNASRGPYKVHYALRRTQEPVLTVRVEAGGEPGRVRGGDVTAGGEPVETGPDRPWDIGWTSSLVVEAFLAAERFEPPMHLAGPLSGVEEIRLEGVRGRLTCGDDELDDATLSWGAGSSGPGGVNRLLLGAEGLKPSNLPAGILRVEQ